MAKKNSNGLTIKRIVKHMEMIAKANEESADRHDSQGRYEAIECNIRASILRQVISNIEVNNCWLD